MVREAGVRRAVFHWYSGPMDVLRDLVDQGYLISATPAVRYSPNHKLAVVETPLENLVLETDCPVEYLGKKSRPMDVIEVCREVASLKGVPCRRVAEVTTGNVLRLLGDRLSYRGARA